ncbi:outer membrane protein assembly factor BamA [Candidatus Venteria ishoeyi]|uniref:outer membrane protein assembly factor BamA n=1 Tax=Candidatus Venteria ishoeyi TaxID=1899563 RepID=UPI0025A6811C|nr:outer membrane protein assembly factor BamA [Candidatus Venteria ishoeyi]MDM8547987.1 outer membrane protein assembly factor BamA [Candidatus Venteria ishoeyi]
MRFKLIQSLIHSLGFLFFIFYSAQALAFPAFSVQEIRLKGLERISPGTVFNYLPVQKGDVLNEQQSQKVIAALFKTGLFNDIRLAQNGGELILSFVERPAISEITYTGNKELDTKELVQALKKVGFAEGRVFDRSILEKVELELQRQYFSLGRYSAQLKTTVTPQANNRVNIQIDISEGLPATIHKITIVGNKDFPDNVLDDVFQLHPTTFMSFFNKSDQYSKQKLAADQEALRAFYLDRGYLNFSIDSTQVSITPDKKHIYITVNINEGQRYSVSGVKLIGKHIVPEAELRSRIKIQAGSVFSRKLVTASTEAISERLGDEGYLFADINAVPEPVAKGSTEVLLNFYIDPGRRVYVRRINFSGNTKTQDEVMRREMRQMEAAWASSKQIKRSQVRLQRLGFFENVDVQTRRIPDVSDQVDIDYTVTERPSGNFLASLGYSQTEGLLFNASVTQENFLGTGKRVGVEFNNSSVNTAYSLSYFDPYFSINGVSQSIGAYYRNTDAEEANLSRYALDSYGGHVRYGFPINEYDNINIGLEPEILKVETTDVTPIEIKDYIAQYGDDFKTLKATTSWAHDTRDRSLFPDRGVLQSLYLETTIPIGDNLEFYKVTAKQHWYQPLYKKFIFLLKAEVAYGESYGDASYPFFENFVAGGPRSIRGFKENTLGPRDSNNDPLGGNLKLVSNLELIMPTPFTEYSRKFRVSAFVDIGNVYGVDEKFKASELRYSTGLAATWLSPMGALSFSLAKPLKKQDNDETQIFQFTLGTLF